MNAWIVAGTLAAAAIGPSGPVAGEPQPQAILEVPPQDAQAQEAERKRLQEQIAKELGRSTQDSGAAPAAAPPSAAPAAAGTSPYARLLALPDLSAIGSFAAEWNGAGERPAFLFEELELGLQSVIDPYARADLFIAIGPDATASLEEGYLTTLSLPAGLQVKAGRFFSPWGRINTQHPHTWDFVDGPLARERVLADEVLAGPGVDVSWLAPLPWFAELHVAAQSTAPVEGDPERLTGVIRLAQFLSLTDETTLGVGLSAARRDEGGGELRDLGGADVYLRWRPPATRTAVTLQGELFGRRISGAGGSEDWGGYAQLFWRAGPHYGAGVRYDQAPVDPADGTSTERRVSAVATWYASEFQRLRLQIARDERPGGQEGWEALVHLEFGIGAHGAHPF
jgi:hypothetical protein